MSDKRKWYDGIRDSWWIIGHTPNLWETFLPRITREKIEEHCSRVKESNCNCVNSSLAHYRWNFLKHADRIGEFIGDLCDIAHKYELKVWEHHSVTLAFPQLIKGVRYKKWQLDKLTKIDFRDGSIFESPKGTSVFCCNNPYFLEAYFDLATKFVIDNPVDIYMPDDMTWAQNYYDCACPYCRKLFKEHTGFNLPKVGEIDPAFFGNMQNPAWRAWLRFRSTRAALFLQELRSFLKSHGRGNLPITTCNTDTLQEYTGRIAGSDHEEYDRVGQLDLGIHEIWGTAESKVYNWVRNFVDQQISDEIGSYCKIPYYAFTYPRFHEEAIFDAARNLSLGMGKNFEGIYLQSTRKSINFFIEEYSAKFFNNQPLSNIGVVFSRNTRDFYKEDIYTRSGAELHCDEFGGWCENLIKMNLPYRVLIDSFIETEDLSSFKVIILPNCACMSAKMVTKLSKFVKDGGTLLATHETSLFDHSGGKLEDFQLAKLFGCKYLTTSAGINLPVVANHSAVDGDLYDNGAAFKTNCYDPQFRALLFEGISERRLPNNRASVLAVPQKDVQILAHSPAMTGFGTGYASITANKFGKGNVLYFSVLPGLMTNTVGVHSLPMHGEDPRSVINEKVPEYACLIRNAITWGMAESEYVKVDPPVDGLLVYLKQDREKKKYYLHLIATPKREIGPDGLALKKYFPETTFDINAGTGEPFGNPLKNAKAWLPSINYVKVPELKLAFSKEIKFTKANMISFDFNGEKKLSVKTKGKHKIVSLPSSSVKRYSVITLE